MRRFCDASFWLNIRNFSKLTRRHRKNLKKNPSPNLPKHEKNRMMEGSFLPYLTASSEGYEMLRDEKYPDFCHMPHAEFPKDLARDVAWALNKLESEGFFYRHWVMVKGRHVLTPVSRTLIGDPGMTYRYLGLRIFALPWSFKDGKALTDIEQACGVIGRLNRFLKVKARQVLQSRESEAMGHPAEQKCVDEGSGNRPLPLRGGKCPQDESRGGSSHGNSPAVRIHSRGGDGSRDQQCPEDSREALCTSHTDNAKDSRAGHFAPVREPLSGAGASLDGQTPVGDHCSVSVFSMSGDMQISLSEDSHRFTNLEGNNEQRQVDTNQIREQSCTLRGGDPPSTRSRKRIPEGRQHGDGVREGQPETAVKRGRPGAGAETVEEGTDFNAALINYMDPGDPELSLKPEPDHNMGRLAVAWHMDGNLRRGSTVAVYSHTCESTRSQSESPRDWMVGIRKPWDGATPALAAPLASGDAYFMLAELNDTHQHCVIAGDRPRFASTHRVVDNSRSTLAYIQSRCRLALENLQTGTNGREDGSGWGRYSLKTAEADTVAQTEEIHNEYAVDVAFRHSLRCDSLGYS